MLETKGKHMQAAVNWDAMINAPQKREAAPMVSVRIPQPLIDASKAEAVRRGIPYSVLFREALVAMLRKETDQAKAQALATGSGLSEDRS
jgi:predicted DNA binding CopG/RHH family protein